MHRDVFDVEARERDAGIHHLEHSVDRMLGAMQLSTAFAPVAVTASRMEFEHGQARNAGAAFAGGDSAHERGTMGDHLLREEPPGRAGDPLDEDARIGIDQDRHRAIPALRDIASTTASTRAAASLSDGV